MSRTIDGKRGSESTSRSASALADRQRVEIELGHEHVFGGGEAARFGDRRDAACRRRPGARTVARAHLGGAAAARGIPRRPARTRPRRRRPRRCPRRRPWRRRSRRRATGADQCGPSAAPHQTNATARPSPSRVKRLPASNRRMSFRSRRRLWAQASTSPGSSDGLRTANFSESGLAIGCRLDARLAERRARVLLEKRERRRFRESRGREDLPDEPVPGDLRRRRRPAAPRARET